MGTRRRRRTLIRARRWTRSSSGRILSRLVESPMLTSPARTGPSGRRVKDMSDALIRHNQHGLRAAWYPARRWHPSIVLNNEPSARSRAGRSRSLAEAPRSAWTTRRRSGQRGDVAVVPDRRDPSAARSAVQVPPENTRPWTAGTSRRWSARCPATNHGLFARSQRLFEQHSASRRVAFFEQGAVRSPRSAHPPRATT